MKRMTLQYLIALSVILFTAGCEQRNKENGAEAADTTKANQEKTTEPKTGYSDVNGISMYYEIYGEGKPIVLIHGGGSTIQSTFARLIPVLAKNRQVIGVELQAHGRTSDRGKPSSFEQDADDVAKLLENLHIAKADFLGFSNGANTTMQIAIRHPQVVNRIIPASGFYKRSGMPPQFWEGMNAATIDNMPADLKEAFFKVNPDSAKLLIMFDRDATRMKTFKDWDASLLKSISAPTLIVMSDKDVASPEHAVEMHRLIPNSQLLIIPGGHGQYMGESSFKNAERSVQSFALLVDEFLSQP